MTYMKSKEWPVAGWQWSTQPTSLLEWRCHHQVRCLASKYFLERILRKLLICYWFPQIFCKQERRKSDHSRSLSTDESRRWGTPSVTWQEYTPREPFPKRSRYNVILTCHFPVNFVCFSAVLFLSFSKICKQNLSNIDFRKCCVFSRLIVNKVHQRTNG